MAGYLFKMYDAKRVLTTALVANNLFMVAFALAPAPPLLTGNLPAYVLLASRALVGFTQVRSIGKYHDKEANNKVLI
jgi:hypothetical protein